MSARMFPRRIGRWHVDAWWNKWARGTPFSASRHAGGFTAIGHGLNFTVRPAPPDPESETP